MQFRCSKCHTPLDSDGEPERCPTCKAEIGFERVDEIPLAMKLFGALLGAIIVTTALGGIVTRLAT